jgi:hypothetical protein
MRDWGFAPSPDDLARVVAAQALYRTRWEAIRPPFTAPFDGTIADVRALDYLAYEGIDLPGGGIEPAALICGEVLRRAAGLEWVVSYRGEWFVASGEDALHEVTICPLARLHEIECGRRRGYGMHLWFVQEAAFGCLLYLEGDARRRTRALLGAEGEYLEWLGRTLERAGVVIP